MAGSVASHATPRWLRNCLRVALALGGFLLPSFSAYAVSDGVKEACKADYYQYCSQYSVGTEELRQCMRNVGEGLSAPCLVALVQEGEITKADVERHNAAQKEGAKATGAKTEKKTREVTDAGTPPDKDSAASVGKGGKEKARKATKRTGSAKLKSSDVSKPSKIASAKKTGETGEKAKSLHKKKKSKSAGDAKTTAANSNKVGDKGKSKKAGKTAKSHGVKSTEKAGKSAKPAPAKKDKKAVADPKS